MHTPPTFVTLMAVAFLGAPFLTGQSANFDIEGKPVQIHGFASQAFSVSNENNYLTMPTSMGSFGFTDFGGNISIQLTGNFRVGAQVYDRNLGQLGQWHPTLDWALADYKFKDWLGIRAGKVKTTLGLYNDTQDLEFLHTWAILPQSMYPLDLRSATNAHVGGDVYGDINLKRLGTLSYTVYAGAVPDDPYGGFVYGSKAYGLNIITLGGKAAGTDVRWNTPLTGLLAGTSYMDGSSNGRGTDPANLPYKERTKQYYVSQFYIQYLHGGFRLEGEYRRNYLDQLTFDAFAPPETVLDSRSFYGAASYRISKRIEIGGYYSRFYANFRDILSSPGNHIFDKVGTVRLDLTSHWDVKIEGHFMNGYATADSFRGFYPQENPLGLKPVTNLLVIRTGVEF
jgi:hypothetical protein